MPTRKKIKPITAWAVICKGQKLEDRWCFEVFSTKDEAEEFGSGTKIIKVKITPLN